MVKNENKKIKKESTTTKNHEPKKKRSGKNKLPELSESQIRFIENKINELGTVEAVGKFYSLNDNVSKFTQLKAKELLK